MPRDNNGTYELPAGNPVVPGTVIASDWANPTMGDLGAEMTDSLSRAGKGGMQAPLRLINGAVDGPSLTFNQDILAGRYLFSPGDMRDTLQNQDRLRFTVDGVFVMIDGVWVPINPTLTGRKNFVINGNFDIWQRGTSFIDNGNAINYSADRWFNGVFGNGLDITRVNAGGDHQYLLRANPTIAGTLILGQRIEGVKPLLGKTVTLSMTLIVNSNVTNAAIRIYDGTAGAGTLLTQPFTPNGATQVITLTGVLAAHVDAAEFWTVDVTGVASAGGHQINILEAQLEIGVHATAFENTPIAETLAMCKRYYQAFSNIRGTIYTETLITNHYFTLAVPPFRSAPTITIIDEGLTGGATGVFMNIGDENNSIAVGFLTAAAVDRQGVIGLEFTADAEL